MTVSHARGGGTSLFVMAAAVLFYLTLLKSVAGLFFTVGEVVVGENNCGIFSIISDTS